VVGSTDRASSSGMRSDDAYCGWTRGRQADHPTKARRYRVIVLSFRQCKMHKNDAPGMGL